MPSIKSASHRNARSLDDVCFLLTKHITKDALRQDIVTYTPEMVYCTLSSITQTEFSITAKQSLKAEKVIIVHHDEYDEQERVEYNRKTYRIYRTYVTDDGFIELYCEVL